MQELSRNKEQLIRREVPKAEALKTFTEKGDQYKVELITDLEDGTISFPEGKTAADCGYGMAEGYWIVPYSGNTYPLDVNGPTFFDDLIQFNKDTLKSKAFGFSFDITNVADQYTACSNIMDKYFKALISGSVDPESTIELAEAEMEAAGLIDIFAENQSQLDAYLAEQQ